MSVDVDLLVVGAGPTGLTAAVAAGPTHSVAVVDLAPRIGGMAASITVAGVRVDLGSHRLHAAATPEVEALIRRLLGDDLQTRARNGRMWMDGRWIRFPPHPVDLARHLPPRFILGAARDLATGPLRRARAIDSHAPAATFADVVRTRLGPSMLDWFYGPYAEKLWGRPPDELAGELARRRIAATSGTALLERATRTLRRTPPTFRYPAHGYGQLVERLADEAIRQGTTIQLDSAVRSLEPRTDVVEVGLADGSQISAGRVFWTAAPGALDRLLGRPDRSPPQRAMACVYLAYPVDRITPFDAHYLPGAESIATRISEPKNYRDGPDPVGVTVLCAEVPCDVGDEIFCADPSDLADVVHRDVVDLGLTSVDRIESHVEHLPSVYPVVAPGAASTVDSRRNDVVPQVTVLGRQGLVVADNIHHVMAMALDAASCLGSPGTADEWDAARWDRALARFEAHVVED